MIAGDALALWSTRRVRCAVLTPDAVGVAPAAAGWMALATMERRARRDGAA